MGMSEARHATKVHQRVLKITFAKQSELPKPASRRFVGACILSSRSQAEQGHRGLVNVPQCQTKVNTYRVC
eukprot:scaffold258805_cov19-Tisochrysis_lutea.AAC.2